MILYDIYNIIWSLRYLESSQFMISNGPKRPSSHHPRCAVFGMWALAVFSDKESHPDLGDQRDTHLKSIWSPSESEEVYTKHQAASWNLWFLDILGINCWLCGSVQQLVRIITPQSCAGSEILGICGFNVAVVPTKTDGFHQLMSFSGLESVYHRQNMLK